MVYTEFEKRIHEDIYTYLRSLNEVDEMLPDATDIEERWPGIAQAYMADGVREFASYPTVSLGWMMYVGMAIAALWDSNWEKHSQTLDLYTPMRDKRGYDALDEYIRQDVLHLSGEGFQAMERLVGECASRTYATLKRHAFEPGTPAAFHAYTACLHQMYTMGAALWLRRMGYHMTEVKP